MDFVNEAPSLSEKSASIREGPAITAIHICPFSLLQAVKDSGTSSEAYE